MSKKKLIELVSSEPEIKKPDFTPPPQRAGKKDKTPFKCPVCEGKGLLPCGFYGMSKTSITVDELVEECRTCKGKGLVWR